MRVQSASTGSSGTESGLRMAIVTGGSGGIGRAAAERLAADGQAVVVVSAGNEAAARTVVHTITAAGGRAVAVQADVADEASVSMVFDLAESSSAASTSSCTAQAA